MELKRMKECARLVLSEENSVCPTAPITYVIGVKLTLSSRLDGPISDICFIHIQILPVTTDIITWREDPALKDETQRTCPVIRCKA